MKLTITIEQDVDELEEGAYIVRLVKDRLTDQESLDIKAHITEQVGMEHHIPA